LWKARFREASVSPVDGAARAVVLMMMERIDGSSGVGAGV